MNTFQQVYPVAATMLKKFTLEQLQNRLALENAKKAVNADVMEMSATQSDANVAMIEQAIENLNA